MGWEITMARITISQAIRTIISHIFGGGTDTSSTNNDDNGANDNDTYTLCPKCNHIMGSINVASTDFIILHIYECPECGTISEYQFDNETNELIKDIHVYDKRVANVGNFSETLGLISYENFSLDRLWSVCGHLCFPVLVKSEFSDRSSLIFVKVGHSLAHNTIDGYSINSNDIIGHVHMTTEHNISHFCNPYLANLPHHKFNYISVPTARCEQLEIVYGIRFLYKKEGHDGGYARKLVIVKDLPLRCMGLELYIKFYTNGISENILMMDLIKGLHVKEIVMGASNIEVENGYSIQKTNLVKITLSATGRENISTELREEFYRDIVVFFSQFDESNPI